MSFERLLPQESSRVAYFSELFRGQTDFDPEFYQDAVQLLANERREAHDADAQLRLDQARFLDAYHPPHPRSRLESDTLIPPYPFYGAELSAISHNPRILYSTSGKPAQQLLSYTSVQVYGTEVIQRILSGVLLCSPQNEADILGTSQLDCCQALAGRRRDGTLLLAHIPGPGYHTLLHGFEEFVKILNPDDELTFIYPVVPEDAYIRQDDADRAKGINAWFQAFADTRDLRAVPFLSTSVPGQRTNSLPHVESAVTVSRYGISIGTHTLTRNPQKGRSPLYQNASVRTFPW